MFLEISQNSQESTCIRVSFLINMQSDAVFKQLKNDYCKTFRIACKRNIFFAEKECRIIKLQVKIVAFREHGDSFNLTLMTLHHNIGNFFNVICSKLFHFLVSSLSLTFSIICLSLFLNAWDPPNCELRGYHCRKQVCIWNLFVPHFSFKLHFPVFLLETEVYEPRKRRI